MGRGRTSPARPSSAVVSSPLPASRGAGGRLTSRALEIARLRNSVQMRRFERDTRKRVLAGAGGDSEGRKIPRAPSLAPCSRDPPLTSRGVREELISRLLGN